MEKQLKPFESGSLGLTVDVRVEWGSQFIEVFHKVRGNLHFIDWGDGDFSCCRKRQDGLWKQTCFEFFIEGKNSEYIEFNFSPIGHWQSYIFSSYRVQANSQLPLNVIRKFKRGANGFIHTSKIYGLDRLIGQKCNGSFISRLKSPIQGSSDNIHWAFNHGSQPDFHDKAFWECI